jgi:predicted ATPase
VRGELRTAHELADQLLDLAQRQHDATLFLQVHRAQGQTLLWLGEFALARSHLAQGRALYNPQQHHGHAFLYGQDPGVACRNFEAQVLWYLGYPDQALESIHAALALSRELSDPFSLAFTLVSAAWLHQYHQEGRQTTEHAEASIALSTAQGFPFFLAMGTILRGWALTVQGQGEEGIAHLRQGLAAWQATGAEILRTFYLALLAEAYGSMGQTAKALAALAEASAIVEQRGECFYAAELHRLKGELLLQSGDYQSGVVTPHCAEVEAYFQQALAIARRQQAKSLELRAAMSLSRLWQQQGKRAEAYELLAPIYGWFTEGFDTADLQKAKTLLEELGG